MEPSGRSIAHDFPFVSTGHLPSSERIKDLVDDAYERFASAVGGQNSTVYPAMQNVPRDLFGICVVRTDGFLYSIGEADYDFTIMSVSKPFLFALICDLIGPEAARNTIGVNSTGLPFNSLAGIEWSRDGRTNPMVNAGAIASTSLVPGTNADGKWRFIHDGLSRFAARKLPLDEATNASASETNFRTRGIANMLHGLDRLYSSPAEAADLYTRQCLVVVSERGLAGVG